MCSHYCGIDPTKACLWFGRTYCFTTFRALAPRRCAPPEASRSALAGCRSTRGVARFIPETQGPCTFYERVESLGAPSRNHTPTPPNTQPAIAKPCAGPLGRGNGPAPPQKGKRRPFQIKNGVEI